MEGRLPDAGDTVGYRDARQAGAEAEGVTLDAGNVIRNRDARQAAAVIEGPIPDAGDAVRNIDARQSGAAREGIPLDDGDAVRDRVIGTCLAPRINMQHRLFFIKQNPIDFRVIHVPRANLDARQAAAAREGTLPDAGDAVGYRDARQAAAVSEGIRPNAGDRFSFDSRRDSERTRYLFITVSDSDRITFNLIL